MTTPQPPDIIEIGGVKYQRIVEKPKPQTLYEKLELPFGTLEGRPQMKQFNINSTVKVRLTQYGKELHKKQWEEFWSSCGRLKDFPYESPKEDENGYCEFQMWDLMEKFGSHCGVLKEVAFETVILIDEGDLKDA